MPKSNLGEERFISAYMSLLQSIMKEARAGKQGRNLETGADAEAMEHQYINAYWLVPHDDLLILLSYGTQD